MTTFDRIAEDLLTAMGYTADYCSSDAEAIEKARNWSADRPYPVYFSPSDTSGEKSYEEFYTEGEAIDIARFKSLGIITDKPVPDRAKVLELITELDGAFESDKCDKSDIVRIISAYLPNFEHIETGKGLDSKM